MRILIIKTSSMGDILHTLPALTDAFQKLKNICFDWIVEEDFIQIPTWHSAVYNVIPIAIRRWKRKLFSISTKNEICNFIYKIRNSSYDVIIDAQGLIKSAFIISFIKNKHEIHGMDYQSAREPYSSFFYKKKHRISKKYHAIERIRKLFSVSLGYNLPSTTGTYNISNNFIYQEIDNPYLVFIHSTTRINKLWPESYWRILIQYVYHFGYFVKLPHGKNFEKQRSYRLAKGFSNVQVLPLLTLQEVAQEIFNATAILSVDTGLSHLAAALDRPNLTLYGPTDPILIGCYGKNQKILRSANYKMQNISAEIVWKEFKNFL